MEDVVRIHIQSAKQTLRSDNKNSSLYWLIWVFCGLVFAGIIIRQGTMKNHETQQFSAAENSLHRIVTRHSADKSYAQIINEQKNRQAFAMRTGVSRE